MTEYTFPQVSQEIKKKLFNCKNCECEFKYKRGGKNLYCSKACEIAFRRSASTTSKVFNCKNCGVEFKPKRHGRTTYCSNPCGRQHQTKVAQQRQEQQASNRKYPFDALNCKHCARLFIFWGKRKQKEPCCPGCKLKLERERKKARRLAVIEKKPAKISTCTVCFSQFYPKGRERLYCTKACSRKKNRRIDKLIRRARLKTVPFERVDPYVVFHRDRWTCVMCKRPTPAKRRGSYHDNAPELDHIIPLSKGGHHTYSNTQCLCRRCNADKSNITMT